MGNTIRCCLACFFPCGALDLARVVHVNGHVKEVAGGVTAGEILAANPGYVLSRPSLHAASPRRITVISPESELKKGVFYFLIPESSLPQRSSVRQRKAAKPHKDSEAVMAVERRKRAGGKVVAWRPHLRSIVEDV